MLTHTHTHIYIYMLKMSEQPKFFSPNFIFKLLSEQVPIPPCYSSPWPPSAAGNFSGEPKVSPPNQTQLILAGPRGKNCFTFLVFSVWKVSLSSPSSLAFIFYMLLQHGSFWCCFFHF